MSDSLDPNHCKIFCDILIYMCIHYPLYRFTLYFHLYATAKKTQVSVEIKDTNKIKQKNIETKEIWWFEFLLFCLHFFGEHEFIFYEDNEPVTSLIIHFIENMWTGDKVSTSIL